MNGWAALATSFIGGFVVVAVWRWLERGKPFGRRRDGSWECGDRDV